MPDFTPTPEQAAIVDLAKRSNENILVKALAGAAKTSTLELIAKAITGKPMLCLAFNKRIADEMAKRLPSHCTCMTMNAIGHRAWGQHTGGRLTVDRDKTANILKNLDLTSAEAKLLREEFGDVLKLVGAAKSSGYIPAGIAGGHSLFTRADFEESVVDSEFSDFAFSLLDPILRKSITQSYDGLIDFNDQVYMSTLFGAKLPRFPVVLVDEAQDLSPLNHYMVERLVVGRLIAVGDPFQSIYGFRGAVSNGMEAFQQKFNMTELGLTISFRCPKSVVRLARSRAPEMKYPDWAVEGNVNFLEEWTAGDLPLAAAIICRNNAPLFSLGLRLLAAGRNVNLRGFDITKRITKQLADLGPSDQSPEDSLRAINRWRGEELSRGKLKAATIDDRASCLEVFVRAAPTLSEASAYAKVLFAAEGPLELLSGHKSKGLEWDHVFFLDPWRVPSKFAESPEAQAQERNLRYVIQTRAKQSLTHINLDQMLD